MNKLLLFFALILFLSCSRNETTSQNIKNLGSYEYQKSSKRINTKNPYSVRFHVEKTSNNSYTIFTDITEKCGAYLASSNSSKELRNNFKIKIQETDLIDIQEDMIEVHETIDNRSSKSFVGSFLDALDSKTTYKQKMIVNTESDFTIIGTIEFLLGEKSNVEKTGIVIKQYNGELVIFTDQC
ncbi:hypothetical protein ACOSP6_16435 [Tenacibaculum sp. MEBiC06402]|uniref:hypothetical protein n=1 Tax=unclassified Tenacibaculum TaxID=2635139 RepID=UPI003B9ACCFF